MDIIGGIMNRMRTHEWGAGGRPDDAAADGDAPIVDATALYEATPSAFRSETIMIARSLGLFESIRYGDAEGEAVALAGIMDIMAISAKARRLGLAVGTGDDYVRTASRILAAGESVPLHGVDSLRYHDGILPFLKSAPPCATVRRDEPIIIRVYEIMASTVPLGLGPDDPRTVSGRLVGSRRHAVAYVRATNGLVASPGTMEGVPSTKGVRAGNALMWLAAADPDGCADGISLDDALTEMRSKIQD